MPDSESLRIAKTYLGEHVTVKFDRPLGVKHPKYDFVYEVNYGFIPGTKAPDGSELDVYYLGVDEPLEKTTGVCIAIVHREDDDDDKLVVVPEGVKMSDDEILSAVEFQEKYFKSRIVR